MTACRLLICISSLAVLFSCDSGPQQDTSPAVAQAYVGPGTLNIRQDLNPKSAAVATLKHGDKLQVLEYRRRFVKVRTAAGIVGWTDNRQLLSPEQMSGLQYVAETTAKRPSQGTASVFETLNMHSEPTRAAPGFLQLSEGAKIEVIEHRLVPRIQTAKPEPILAPIPKPKPMRRRLKDKERSGKNIGPPPMPAAPLPPKNWLEMSRTNPEPAAAPATPLRQPEPPKPVPMDDWYLARTKDGKAGWVLARMVTMAIPDEVAQYAEGHRITSYFPLGKIDDDGTIKNNWLWTTINKGGENYEYDSFRIFVWSRRHHRYETAYIERNVVGHFPTEVNTSGENPTFTLLLEDDGKLYRKTYEFNGYRVHLLSSQPYEEPGAAPAPVAIAQNTEPAGKQESWYTSMKARVRRLFRR